MREIRTFKLQWVIALGMCLLMLGIGVLSVLDHQRLSSQIQTERGDRHLAGLYSCRQTNQEHRNTLAVIRGIAARKHLTQARLAPTLLIIDAAIPLRDCQSRARKLTNGKPLGGQSVR